MIRFSNRVKYGLQFLLFLNVDSEEYTDIQRAAISCEIPHKFLESIAVSLKKSGIVVVKRGAGGGYRLNRNPQEVTLAQVVRAIEGLDESDKTHQNNRELTREVVEDVFENAMDQFWRLLDEVTLNQMYKTYSSKTEQIMYYI